ncbi:MAG: hypothetical protein NZO16_06265, partial [Deltaproteobacteria bacterium]|nr:hypothetical protein [Deltaproteobacteria bacterium]
MQIRKCLETRIIRQTEEIICEREILSKVYRVHPTKIQNKFVFEAFSEGFLLGGEIERSSIRFKIIWDLLTKDQKPFLGFYFSHNFSEIALLEQFPLISPFEEEVVIKFGFPDLICRCKLSNLCEMTVLANNSVFELFQKNIFVFKVKDHKKITY